MRVAPDPGAVEWLERLKGGSGDFEWDGGNRTKHEKHGVGPADIEAMLDLPAVFAGRIVHPEHSEPRWLLLGRNSAGRYLTLIFTRRGQRIRAISCRAMRRNERKVYEEALHEERSA